MEKSKRTVYSKEFKIEAIKMVLESNDSVPAIASKLGIQPNQLYNWMQSHRLPGEIKSMINKHKDMESEIRELKKKLARAEQEKEILKKAAAYFAKEAQ